MMKHEVESEFLDDGQLEGDELRKEGRAIQQGAALEAAAHILERRAHTRSKVDVSEDESTELRQYERTCTHGNDPARRTRSDE